MISSRTVYILSCTRQVDSIGGKHPRKPFGSGTALDPLLTLTTGAQIDEPPRHIRATSTTSGPYCDPKLNTLCLQQCRICDDAQYWHISWVLLMDISWESHESPVGRPWELHRNSMGLPWTSHASTNGNSIPWISHGTTRGRPTRVPWATHGPPLLTRGTTNGRPRGKHLNP